MTTFNFMTSRTLGKAQTVFLSFLAVVAFSFSACTSDDGTTPTTTAPSNLQYEPNSLTTDEGTAATSANPTIEGSVPVTLSMTSTPDAAGEITIDANTGVISVSAAAGAGVYSITVTGTNPAGSTEFADAYTVNVVGKITYTEHIQPAIKANCAPCHITGGANTNYGDMYDNAKGNVDGILDRIQRDEAAAGFMPLGGTKVSAAIVAAIEQWKADGLLEN